MEGAWYDSLRDAKGDMHRALIEVNVTITIWYTPKMKHVYAPHDLGTVEVDPVIGVGDTASEDDAVVLVRDYYHFTREIKYRVLAESKIKCTWIIRAGIQRIDKNTLLFSYEPLGTDGKENQLQEGEEEANSPLPQQLSLVNFWVLTDAERRKIHDALINKLHSLLPNISPDDLIYATGDILFILEVKKIFETMNLGEAEEISHDKEVNKGKNVGTIRNEWKKRKNDWLKRLTDVNARY